MHQRSVLARYLLAWGFASITLNLIFMSGVMSTKAPKPGAPGDKAYQALMPLLHVAYALAIFTRPLALMALLAGIFLVPGNILVGKRLDAAYSHIPEKERPAPGQLTRQEWLDVVFRQDAVDYEVLARRLAIDELREKDVLQTPSEYSSIEDPLSDADTVRRR
jgi:hypothetical protein